MLDLLRKSVPSKLSKLSGMGTALRGLLPFQRTEPTTFQRCLAVHMHFAARPSALD